MGTSSRRPPSLLEHTKVGNYAIVRFLGAGGMAEVYEVEHVVTRGKHALKILHARYTGEFGPSIAMQLEAMVEAQLRHENIVRCTDAGEHDGRLWIVMDLLTHMTGDELIRRGPLPLEVVARIVTQLAAALAAAHKRGIVHRDVKPSNFHVLHDGLVKLGDFGFLMPPEDAVSMSRSETMPGTPAYMAPEQLACENVDHRADIFALAQTTYEMILGRHGWGTVGRPPAYADVLRRAGQLPPSLCELIPGFPEDLWRVLATALAPERDARYSSVVDFARDFANAVARSEQEHGSNSFRIREGRQVYVPSFAHVTAPDVIFRRHWVTKALVSFREEMAAQFPEDQPAERPEAEELAVRSGDFPAWAALHSSTGDLHDEGPRAPTVEPYPTPCAWESAPGNEPDRSTREPGIVSVIDPAARWSDPTDAAGLPAVSASSSPITPVSISRPRSHEPRHDRTLALGTPVAPVQSRRLRSEVVPDAAKDTPKPVAGPHEVTVSTDAAPKLKKAPRTTDSGRPHSTDAQDTIVDPVPWAVREHAQRNRAAKRTLLAGTGVAAILSLGVWTSSLTSLRPSAVPQAAQATPIENPAPEPDWSSNPDPKDPPAVQAANSQPIADTTPITSASAPRPASAPKRPRARPATTLDWLPSSGLDDPPASGAPRTRRSVP